MVWSTIRAADVLIGENPTLSGLRTLMRGNPTCSPAWLRAWYHCFGDISSDPVIVTRDSDARPVGFLALTVRSRGPMNLVRSLRSTTNGHSQYTALVIDDGAPDTIASALMDALLARNDWDLLQLQGVVSHDADVIAQAARKKGLAVEITREFSNLLAKLDADAELPARSRATKKRRARLEKALYRSGHVVIEATDRSGPLEQAFSEYLRSEHRSWKASDGELISATSEIEAFYRQLIEAASDDLRVVIYLLKRDGTAIAGLYTVSNDKSVVALKIFHDEAARRYSPGFVLLRRLMQDVRENPDVSVVDLFSARSSLDAISNSSRIFRDMTIWNRTARARMLRRVRNTVRYLSP